MVSIVENGAEWADALRLAKAFHGLGVWAHAPLDIDAVSETFQRAADQDSAFLSFSKDSLILGVMTPLWFSPQTTIGVELIWYSETPGRGKEMREAFERWTFERGAASVQFSCMANDHEPALRRLFARAGFEPVEIGFRKAA